MQTPHYFIDTLESTHLQPELPLIVILVYPSYFVLLLATSLADMYLAI